jgi:hypothetical protein
MALSSWQFACKYGAMLNDNPYQPPSATFSEAPTDRSDVRPLGIAILSVLHILGGLLMAALGIFLASRFDEEARRSIFGLAPLILSPVLALLTIGIAVGLWRAKKWAWWLATFYYFQFAAGAVIVLTGMAIGYLVFGQPFTPRTEQLCIKHVGRLVLFSWLTSYMMTGRVFVWFKFERLTRLRAIGILSGITFLMIPLLTVMVFVAVKAGVRLG